MNLLLNKLLLLREQYDLPWDNATYDWLKIHM